MDFPNYQVPNLLRTKKRSVLTSTLITAQLAIVFQYYLKSLTKARG